MKFRAGDRVIITGPSVSGVETHIGKVTALKGFHPLLGCWKTHLINPGSIYEDKNFCHYRPLSRLKICEYI